MRRLALSILLGLSFTVLLFVLPTGIGWQTSASLSLLFWPVYLISWSWIGLDCPNANEISDKLNCVYIAFAVDILAYSILFYLFLWLVDKIRGAPRPDSGLSIK